MRRRLRVRGEDGFTIIEVMMSIFLLVVGLSATLAAFASSDHLNLTAQRQQSAMTLAEQTMEQLRSMSYSNLVMSSLPSHTTDGNATSDTSGNPTNPDYWVSGSNLIIPQNFNQESSGTLSGTLSSGEAMVSGTGGTVSPETDNVSVGGFTATVYRFVTWVDDHCILSAVELCVGTQNAKRVTVAVRLGGGGNGVQKPVWLSTLVGDPKAGISG